MLRGQPLTVVIPVRGGSKGIPRKNLYQLGKDTLLERAIKIAKASKYVDRVLVTTDDEEMFRIADCHSVAIDGLRSPRLSRDDSSTVDVVQDALDRMDITDGWILLLQATTPLRTLSDLNEFCRLFAEDGAGSGAAVSLVAHDSPHPQKIQVIRDGFVEPFLGGESMVARQSLPEVFALNGAFYLTHIRDLKDKKSFRHQKTMPFVMSEEKSINLDNWQDMLLLESMLERKLVDLEEY